MAQLSLTNSFLQAATTATMHCQAEQVDPPTSPYPTLSASTEHIFKTDCTI